VSRWASAAVAIVTLWLAAWIFIPAPTYFFLTFSVGAPEVSAWTILMAVFGIAIGARVARSSRVARGAVTGNAVAIALCLTVWLRIPSTIHRFDAAMRGMSAEPGTPRRAHPIVIRDLFRPIATGEARVTQRVPVMTIDGVPLSADVYQPVSDRALHPIVVQIYGGAWQRGSPDDDAVFARWLAASGYVVFAIDYRHAPRFHWPAQLDDVDSMLVWIAAHARDFGGDTARVVLLGRSAGAHLATMAAWRGAPIHVRAVVSFYGPADLIESYRRPPRPDPLNVRAVERALIGGPLESMEERYADASTVTFVRDRAVVPSLLIYGGRDNIVEARYGAKLVALLEGTGSKVAYLEIPWASHAFDAVRNGPSSQLALYYVERFLAWATGEGGDRR
jgi:acetyl esterase/lipase